MLKLPTPEAAAGGGVVTAVRGGHAALDDM
jgi:hypothetical protein